MPEERQPMSPPSPEYRPTHDYENADNSMRNLALGAVAIAAVVMGGVYVLSGRHHAAVPVIEADSRPIRIKPTDPGGMQIANSDDATPTSAGGAEADQVLPPPEAPAPQMLQQQAQVAAAPPAAKVPEPPKSVAAAPPAAPPVSVAKPAPPPPVVRGHAEVQFAALDSEAAAKAAWVQLNHRLPELLAGRTAKVERAELDGKVFWRLRSGGFADVADATAFCARLRAKSAACTIASF